jgi:hypothetical protein
VFENITQFCIQFLVQLLALVKDEDGNPMCPRIAIIAPSGAGKSYVLRSIMDHMFKNMVLVMRANT